MPTIKPKEMSLDEMRAFLNGEIDLGIEADQEVVLLDKHEIESFIHKCCSCGLLHEILIQRLRDGWSIRFREVDKEEFLEREIFDVLSISK